MCEIRENNVWSLCSPAENCHLLYFEWKYLEKYKFIEKSVYIQSTAIFVVKESIALVAVN